MCSNGGGCNPGEDEGARSVGEDWRALADMDVEGTEGYQSYAALQTAGSSLGLASCLNREMLR